MGTPKENPVARFKEPHVSKETLLYAPESQPDKHNYDSLTGSKVQSTAHFVKLCSLLFILEYLAAFSACEATSLSINELAANIIFKATSRRVKLKHPESNAVTSSYQTIKKQRSSFASPQHGSAEVEATPKIHSFSRVALHVGMHVFLLIGQTSFLFLLKQERIILIESGGVKVK